MEWNNTSGGNVFWTVKLKVNGTTLHQGTFGLPSGVTRRTVLFDWHFLNQNATNVNYSYAEYTLFSVDGSTPNTFAGGQVELKSTSGALTIDTTADVTITVTVQMDVANANAKFRERRSAVLLVK
jgi:hypothetical protein